MFLYNLIKSTAVLGLCGLPLMATPASAGCRGGFICEALQGVPGVGAIAGVGDQAVGAWKDRTSDADVLHQATSSEAWNNPVGAPANAPAPGYSNPPPPVAYLPPPPPTGYYGLTPAIPVGGYMPPPPVYGFTPAIPVGYGQPLPMAYPAPY